MTESGQMMDPYEARYILAPTITAERFADLMRRGGSFLAERSLPEDSGEEILELQREGGVGASES